jgi:hypothetical protein
MNGRTLTLSALAGLAVAGLVAQRRGSRSMSPIHDALLRVVQQEPEDVALWTLEVWATAFRTDGAGRWTAYLNDDYYQMFGDGKTGWEQYQEDMKGVGKDLRTIAAEELEKGHWLVPVSSTGSTKLLAGVVREVRRILALPRVTSVAPPASREIRKTRQNLRQPQADLQALARALPGLVAWAEEHGDELGTTKTFTQAAYAAQRFVPQRRSTRASVVTDLLTIQTWKEILKWQDYLDDIALLEKYPDSDPMDRPAMSENASVLMDYLTETGAAELPSTHWLSLDQWTKTFPSGEKNPLIKKWIKSIDPAYAIRYGHRRGIVNEFLTRYTGGEDPTTRQNRELFQLIHLMLSGS